MEESLSRLALLIQSEGIKRLKEATVMIIGVGGVGSYAAESLARSGIGHLILVDHDVIAPSNLNRQIHANLDTIGQLKTEAMKQRIASFMPSCEVSTHSILFDASQAFLFEQPLDYVIDAIDTVSCKIDCIELCQQHKIPLISSLGMANRFDSSAIIQTTLDKTNYDPLARALRQQMKKRGIDYKIEVIFSKEIPVKQNQVVNAEGNNRKERIPPASSSFVPAAGGLLCGSIVVRKLLNR